MKQIVLMYHDVYSKDILESGFCRERDLVYKLDESSFENQVREISKYCELNKIPKEKILFSFDDGGISFKNVIAPILDKYGYKGLFFISAKYIGSPTFLSENDILSLYLGGHIIGSHAYSHEHLYKLSDDEVKKEWQLSVDILKTIINSPILYASIPNGDISKRVIASAYQSGIRKLYTSEPTLKISRFKDMNIHGRYVILSSMDTKSVLRIISSPYVRFKLSCKRALIRVIKAILGDRYILIKNKLLNR